MGNYLVRFLEGRAAERLPRLFGDHLVRAFYVLSSHRGRFVPDFADKKEIAAHLSKFGYFY